MLWARWGLRLASDAGPHSAAAGVAVQVEILWSVMQENGLARLSGRIWMTSPLFAVVLDFSPDCRKAAYGHRHGPLGVAGRRSAGVAGLWGRQLLRSLASRTISVQRNWRVVGKADRRPCCRCSSSVVGVAGVIHDIHRAAPVSHDDVVRWR